MFAFVLIKKPLVFINLKLSQFTVYAYVDFFDIKCKKINRKKIILHPFFFLSQVENSLRLT